MPTAGQLAGWVPFVESHGLLQGNLQSNALLDQVAYSFVASTLFGNTYNSGTAVDPNAPITANIVASIIQHATGVAATSTQVNAWVSTGLTIDQVFVMFALGNQYTASSQAGIQQYLTALADNHAGFATLDGSAASGALTFGTVTTPLSHDGLTILGGSGALSVVTTGQGDTITELGSSTSGGTIIASGAETTIDAAAGVHTITASGANDSINLGVVDTGETITAAQTVHASGASDMIMFANTAADGTAVTWAAASTVDGGTSSTGIGANATVIFGNNTAGGSETVVLTGTVAGGTTAGGTSTSGIAMTTLANVVHAGGDVIVFDNAATEQFTSTAVNVSAASSLAQALDLAAAAAQSGGHISASTGVIEWFQYSGNTYAVEAVNAGTSAASHPALASTDEVIKIVGLVDLSTAAHVGHTLVA